MGGSHRAIGSFLTAAVMIGTAVFIAPRAWALFVDGANVGANTFGSATLAPASALTLTRSCGSTTATVHASWAASPSTFASGYRLERWSGGTHEATVAISGGGTTTATDPGVVTGKVYEYRLIAEFHNWTSPAVATTITVACSSQIGLGLWSRASGLDNIAANWVDPNFTTKELLAPTGRWRVMQAEGARSRDEVIAVGVNPSGQIQAQMRGAGGVWTAVSPSPLATVSASNWWSFDIAYETASDDAMLVWANGTTGTSGLSYRVWNGSTWSPTATITTPLAGEPQQLHLAADPTSDEMVLVVGNADMNDYALVWDGNQWVAADSLVLDSSGRGNRTDTNVVYESLSGDAMVVYRSSNGVAAEPVYYRMWNGSAWSAEASVAPPAGGLGHPEWIMLASDPGTDRLALGALTDSTDIWLASWSGTAWSGVTAASTKGTTSAAPTIALGFEDVSGRAVAVYSETGKTQFRYRVWTAAGGWGPEGKGPNLPSVPNSMVLYPRPGTDHLMLAVQDADAQVSDILWDAITPWLPPVTFDPTGETSNQPFGWVWR